jgi:hypothetical protein
MCEVKTRVWCCRIVVLLFVLTSLLMMVLQIWNYYFLLVDEMDMLEEKTPQLVSILEFCNSQVVYKWNIDCVQEDNVVGLSCGIAANTYIHYHGIGQVVSNSSQLQVTTPNACLKIMIWILPW